MNTQEILAAIGPGLTLYGVLVTLGILFFRLGSALRRNEHRIENDFLARLREVRDTFREAHIEPLIGRRIAEAAKEGIQAAFELVITLKIDPTTKQPFADYATLAAATSDERLREEMNQMTSRISAERLMAASQAEQLLDDMDMRYMQRYGISRLYERVKHYNRLGYLLLWGLGLLFFGAIIRLLFPNTPPYLVVSYINLVGILLLVTFGIVIRYYFLERAFERLHEQITLYPRGQTDRDRA